MLNFLTRWWRKRRADVKQIVAPLSYAPKLPEQVHLHISDFKKTPAELIWNAKTGLVSDFSQETNQTAPALYDEYLLEKSRTQWQFGDWKSLMKLDRDTLQQQGDISVARQHALSKPITALCFAPSVSS